MSDPEVRPEQRVHRQVTLAGAAVLGAACAALLRRDDLVGGAAGQFRHVVELEGERADAGGRRAHLDDEVADLGFRHLARAPMSQPSQPSRVSKPRIWPRRPDRIALILAVASVGQTISTRWIGSSSTGWHCGRPSTMPMRPAVRNAMSEEVDRVIGAVDQRDREIDHREAERAVLERVDDALLDRRDVIARHHAAGDLLLELEAGAARQRLDLEHHVAELAVTAGLLLVAAAHAEIGFLMVSR